VSVDRALKTSVPPLVLSKLPLGRSLLLTQLKQVGLAFWSTASKLGLTLFWVACVCSRCWQPLRKRTWRSFAASTGLQSGFVAC
jgi:hypothetical protein